MGGGEEWVSGVITQVACGFQLNSNPGAQLKRQKARKRHRVRYRITVPFPGRSSW